MKMNNKRSFKISTTFHIEDVGNVIGNPHHDEEVMRILEERFLSFREAVIGYYSKFNPIYSQNSLSSRNEACQVEFDSNFEIDLIPTNTKNDFLKRGDIVQAIRDLDVGAANVKKGDVGFCFGEANCYNDGCGVVRWLKKGELSGVCNVYPGDVEIVFEADI